MSRLELISLLKPIEEAAAGLNLALHDAAKGAEPSSSYAHRAGLVPGFRFPLAHEPRH